MKRGTTKTKTMITPTPTTTQFTAKVNAADLATLIGAIAAANVITMPDGKTLAANVAGFNLALLPHALPDGTVAMINGQLK